MEEQDKISLNDRIVNFVSNNIVWVLLGFIVIVIILPRLFIGTSKIGFLDNLKPNEIGDAIGGMTAPIIGLFSAFLVYIAFREQKKANDELIKFNKQQLISNEINSLFAFGDKLEIILNDINSDFLNKNSITYSEISSDVIHNLNNMIFNLKHYEEELSILNDYIIENFKNLEEIMTLFEKCISYVISVDRFLQEIYQSNATFNYKAIAIISLRNKLDFSLSFKKLSHEDNFIENIKDENIRNYIKKYITCNLNLYKKFNDVLNNI
jgi:hypothetical protein